METANTRREAVIESGGMGHFGYLLIKFHRSPTDYAQCFGIILRKVIQTHAISCFSGGGRAVRLAGFDDLI